MPTVHPSKTELYMEGARDLLCEPRALKSDATFTCIHIPAWSISGDDISCVSIAYKYARQDLQRLLSADKVKMLNTGNCTIHLLTPTHVSDDDPPNPLASMLVRRQIRGDAVLLKFDKGVYRFSDLVNARYDLEFYARDEFENMIRLCCTWKL